MALRKTGISLTVDGLNRYVSDIDKATSATRNFSKLSLGSGDIGKSLGNIGDMSSIGKQSGFSFADAFKLGFVAKIGADVWDGLKAGAALAGRAAGEVYKQGFEQLKISATISADFSQSLSGVQADLTNLNPQLADMQGNFDPAQAKQLAETIRSIAIDPKLQVGLTDAAQATKTLTRYGFSLNEIQGGALEATVLLQNATGSSYQLAAETLAKYAVLNKVEPSGLAKAVGQISATISSGGYRDLNDYRYALVNAAGEAKSLAISELDLNTALAIANPLFASGRTNGTAFTSFLQHLTPNTDKASDAMKALNLSFFDAKGNFVGMDKTVALLRQKFAGLTQEQRAQGLETIFGTAGMKFANVVLEDVTDAQIAHTRTIIANADAYKTATVRTNNLKDKLVNLGDVIEGLRVDFVNSDFLANFIPPIEAFSLLLKNASPQVTQFGQKLSAAFAPSALAATEIFNSLAAGKGIGNFQFGLGPVKVIKFEDLFSLDIAGIEATFQKGLREFHIGNLVSYFDLGQKQHFNIGDFFVFDQNAEKTKINLSKYITFVRDSGGSHFNIADLFTIDDTAAKTEINLSKYVTIAHDKIKGTVDLEVGTFNTSIDVAGLKEKLGGIGLAIGAMGLGVISADSALKDLSAPTGGLGQLRAFVTNTIGSLSESISGIDANKTASVGLTITSTITGVLGVLTKLSDLGNENVGAAAASLTSLTTSLLGFATGVTTGLDGAKIGDSAGGFISSLIDEFTIVLKNPKIPDLTVAAGGFLVALTGKFKDALSSDGPKVIGESIGGLGATLIEQIGRSLAKPTLGKDIGKSIVNVADAFGTGANNLALGIANELGKVDYSKFGGQVHSFVASMLGEFNKGVKDQLEKNKQNAARDAEGTGKKTPRGAMGQALSQEGGKTADSLAAGVANAGKFLSGLILGTTQDAADLSTMLDAKNRNNQDQASAQRRVDTNTGLLPVEVGGYIQDMANNKSLAGVPGAVTLNAASVVVTGPAAPTPVMAATPESRQNYQNYIANNNSGGNGPPIAGIQDATDFSSVLAGLNAQSQAAGANLESASSSAAATITGAAATVAGGAATAGANLASVQIFPGWGTYIQPVNISSKIPVLNWHEFITPITPTQPSSKAILGFAAGTPSIPDNNAYIAGEHGPELIFNQKGKTVLPAGQTQQVLDHSGKFIDNQVFNAKLKIKPEFGPFPNAPIPSLPSGGPKLGPDTQPVMAAQQKQLNEGVNNLVGQVDKTKEGFKNLGLSIQDLQSDLKGVPGLFGSSTVTAEDMAAAKAGTYIEKADELVRQVQDAAKNGVQYPTDVLGQARDAIAKIGVTPVGDNVGLADQFKALFASGQLFSNKDNLGLINANAVEASIKQQEAQKQGQANIESYFTSMFGGGLSAAVSTGLASAGLGTGGAAQVSSAGGPLGQVPDFPGWTGKDGLIPNFPGWTDKGGLVPKFPGWAQPDGFIPDLNWDDYIDSIKKTATPPVDPAAPVVPVPKKASGSNYLRGFAAGTNRLNSIITGENGPELSLFPDGTRIFPAGKTAKIMGIAEALARHLPSIQSDPFASLFGGRVSQPQVNVIYRPQTTQQATPNMTKVFQLNLTSQQGADNIMRDFQHMQVVAGAR